MTTLQEHLDEIMDTFPFHRCVAHMGAAGWKWRGKPVEEPDMRREARRMVTRFWQLAHKDRTAATVSCGGLEASVSFHAEGVNVRLAFVVAECETNSDPDSVISLAE